MSRRFVFLTPTYKPVGGVVKIFDYVTHARALGFEVRVHCPDPYSPDLPLFGIDRFAGLPDDDGVELMEGHRFGLAGDDYCFVSWPTDFEHVAPVISPAHDPRQVVLIVQNVRWANPAFAGGYAVRLLSRPMARIMITDQVAEAVADLVDPATPTRVILEGHDWPYFSKERSGGLGDPVRVAYTTWKSEVGIEAERILAEDGGFEFRSIRSTVGWPELKELYHWADVFLGCPGPEEGFYLPGLEAFAAGCLLVISDAGGNLAYSDFGTNCVEVPLDDAAAYAAALRSLRERPATEVEAMRNAGYAVLERHRLEREREEFGRFLAELDTAIGAVTDSALEHLGVGE